MARCNTIDSNRFLTTKEAADFLGFAEITLAMWRHYRKGPPFVRIGRHIRYRLTDLEDYMAGRYAEEDGPVKVFPEALPTETTKRKK